MDSLDSVHQNVKSYSLFRWLLHIIDSLDPLLGNILPNTIHHRAALTIPKGQILDSFKLKEFVDDNSKFQENDRRFSKGVENTVGKGEIAHYEQFLLFPQCFQKTCTADM